MKVRTEWNGMNKWIKNPSFYKVDSVMLINILIPNGITCSIKVINQIKWIDKLIPLYQRSYGVHH